MNFIRLSSILVLGVGLAGCAQAPSSELENADRALQEAQAAQAADYAPEAWSDAKDAEARLLAERGVQEQRWAIARSYGRVRELAAETENAAKRSIEEAQVGKAKVRDEASALMTQARDEYARAQKAIESAPHGKGTQADLASFKADATTIEETLRQMQASFDAGDFLDAASKAQSALDQSRRIVSEIENAGKRRPAA